MTQNNVTTILSVIAAVILASVQAMQHVTIKDNHITTHEKIEALDKEVVPRKEIERTYIEGDEIVALQLTHSIRIHEMERDAEEMNERLISIERQMDSMYKGLDDGQ